MDVEKVFIIPTAVDYHRGDKLPWLGDREKIKTINAMMEGFDKSRWEIWDKELRLRSACAVSSDLLNRLSNNHRFIDTLVDFLLEHPECIRPYVIIGADQAVNFGSWAEHEAIMKLAQIVVVPSNSRACEEDIPKWLPHETLRIDKKYDEISASYFREKYRNYPVDLYIDEVSNMFFREKKLLHTPIFDVVSAPEVEAGFRPVKVRAPDWVTIIATDSIPDKVLVERQFRYGSNCEVEEFPCGMVEDGEAPIYAAVRELEEETGIKLLEPEKQLIPLGVTNPNPAFMTNKMHYYWVDMSYAKFVQVDRKLDEHEKIDFKWTDAGVFFNNTLEKARASAGDVPAILLSAIHLYNNRKIPLVKDEASDKRLPNSQRLHHLPLKPGYLR